MDNQNLLTFLERYSLPTIIIAVVVAIASLLSDKLLTEKVSIRIRSYVPIGLGIFLNFLYTSIFVNQSLSFNEEVIYSGFLSGSLSGIFFSILRKIFSGEKISPKSVVLAIESIIKDCFTDDAICQQTATKIDELLEKAFAEENFDEDELANKIATQIKSNSIPKITEEEILHLTLLIIKTVKALR